ncbi:MAG: pantoate kinase [Nitrososphaerales archaeon]
MRSIAFSPGHITGFVQFPDAQKDPLLNGSLGAGFCICKGVRTIVNIENASSSSCSILINGKLVNDAQVSRYVVDELLSLVNDNYKIIVEHQSEIPSGYGLGSSGAAALSLAFALNQALGTPLNQIEAAQVAHKADLACRCGAGTVLAEFHGGFEMRLVAGAPGIGVLEKIPLNDKKVVLFCLAPIPTKDFLTNRIQLFNGIGGKMLAKLSKTRSVDDFMSMSLQFARSIGCMNYKCKVIIEDLLANGYSCSTAMFGETIFSIVKNDDVEDVKKILMKYNGTMLISDIENHGAKIC